MEVSIIVMGMKNDHHQIPSRRMPFSSAAEWVERSGAADGVSGWRLNGNIVARNWMPTE